MKNILERTVYYGDTDAYGVVWHASYLRWMEQGRVEMCRDLGIDLVELKKQNIMIPVTNLNMRFKASAKLDEKILVETEITKMSPITITFTHTVRSKETGKACVITELDVVAVNNEGKIYRRIPDVLRIACEKAMEN